MLHAVQRRAVRGAGAAVLLVTLGGCAALGGIGALGTIAGGSAGAIAGKAIGASGPWGYVASVATSAVGGLVGNKVTGLLSGKGNHPEQTALIRALEAPAPLAFEPYGAQDGKGKGGYAQATGAAFQANSGAICRPFMLVTYKKPRRGLAAIDPGALQNGVGAARDAKASADKLGTVHNATDAASVVQSVGSAAGQAQAAVAGIAPAPSAAPTAATPTAAGAAATPAAAPAGSAAAPTSIAPAPARLPGSETFGTACKDAKKGWRVIAQKG